MSSFAWFIVFFFILLFVSVIAYVVVVKLYYWGDRSGQNKRKEQDRENPWDRR